MGTLARYGFKIVMYLLKGWAWRRIMPVQTKTSKKKENEEYTFPRKYKTPISVNNLVIWQSLRIKGSNSFQWDLTHLFPIFRSDSPLKI